MGVEQAEGLGYAKFSWEFPQNIRQYGINAPAKNTEYYLRMVKDINETNTYVKTKYADDWTWDFKIDNKQVKYDLLTHIVLMFGNDIDALHEYWRGSINMKHSYIILNGNKYKFKLRRPSN